MQYKLKLKQGMNVMSDASVGNSFEECARRTRARTLAARKAVIVIFRFVTYFSIGMTVRHMTLCISFV